MTRIITVPMLKNNTWANVTEDQVEAHLADGWVRGFEYASGPIPDADLLLQVVPMEVVREWLRQHGATDFDGMTHAELVMLLLRHRGHTEHAYMEVVFLTTPDGAAAGGEAVLVQGQGFAAGRPGVTTVLFGGVPATVVNIVDDATISCTTPAHDAGVVDVTVQNANGSSTLPGAYTYS